MNLVTKLPLRAYMQRVRRNRGIYCDVNAPKCTNGFRYFFIFKYNVLNCIMCLELRPVLFYHSTFISTTVEHKMYLFFPGSLLT